MQTELVTMAEYARRRGCSRAAVTLAVRRCNIPLTEGRLDPVVADAVWASRTDGEMARRAITRRKVPASTAPAAPAPAADPACTTWRERRDRAQARLVELRVAEREGSLLDLQRAKHEFWGAFHALTGLLEAFPARVAHKLVNADDRTIHVVLGDGIYQMRHDLVTVWEGRMRDGLMSEAIKAMLPIDGRQ